MPGGTAAAAGVPEGGRQWSGCGPWVGRRSGGAADHPKGRRRGWARGGRQQPRRRLLCRTGARRRHEITSRCRLAAVAAVAARRYHLGRHPRRSAVAARRAGRTPWCSGWETGTCPARAAAEVTAAARRRAAIVDDARRCWRRPVDACRAAAGEEGAGVGGGLERRRCSPWGRNRGAGGPAVDGGSLAVAAPAPSRQRAWRGEGGRERR